MHVLSQLTLAAANICPAASCHGSCKVVKAGSTLDARAAGELLRSLRGDLSQEACLLESKASRDLTIIASWMSVPVYLDKTWAAYRRQNAEADAAYTD